MFIRAQLSAQIATFVDFLISILLNQCANVYYGKLPKLAY